MSAAEGQQITSMIVNTLKAMRSDEAFELFWEHITVMAVHWKYMTQFFQGKEKPQIANTPKALYRQLYFESPDSATCCIVDRMEQPGYKVYSMLEQLLLKSCTGDNIEECFQVVCSFYKDDFQPGDLLSQLTTFGTNFRSTLKNNCSIITIKGSAPTHPSSFETAPACSTNATSEQSFRALRRVKTFKEHLEPTSAEQPFAAACA